jgi:hypothetical protein
MTARENSMRTGASGPTLVAPFAGEMLTNWIGPAEDVVVDVVMVLPGVFPDSVWVVAVVDVPVVIVVEVVVVTDVAVVVVAVGEVVGVLVAVLVAVEVGVVTRHPAKSSTINASAMALREAAVRLHPSTPSPPLL